MSTDARPATKLESKENGVSNAGSTDWSDVVSEAYSRVLADHTRPQVSSSSEDPGKIKASDEKSVCYLGWAQTNFDVIDTDKNGFITGREVDSGYRNSRISQKEHYGLNGLRTFYQQIQQASNDEWFRENDGITRADLAEYQREQLARNWQANRARRSKVD